MTKQIVYQLVDNNPDTCVGEIAEGDIFRVEPCGYCVVTTNNAAGGPFPILIQTAPGEFDQLIINDVPAQLTLTNNVVVLDIPGLYKVQVPVGTDTLVCVECYENKEAPCSTFQTGQQNIPTANTKEPFTSIHKECFVDDVNSDGTTFVGFVRATCIAITQGGGLISTLLGDFTSQTLSVPYNVMGTVGKSKDIGDQAVTKVGRVELTNGEWRPDVLTTSFTIRVHAVGDMNNPPTITDSFNNTTDIFVNETISYSDIEPFGDGLPVITAGTNDRVFITYTTLGA